MFNIRQPKVQTTELDETITNLISEMAGFSGDSEGYAVASGNLKVLIEARAAERESRKPNMPSADTIAIVAGNLAGIFAILSFEKANVVTSKSLSLIMKPRS